MNNEATEDDRPRAMLNPADRQFLLGEKEYKHRQTASDRRKAIRDRVVGSLSDFSLLFGYLSKHEREKIADEIGMNKWADAPDHSSMVGAPRGIIYAIAFLYRLHRDVFDAENATKKFEETASLGVAAALGKELGEQWSADIEITLERPPTRETIKEKWADDGTEALSGPEAKRLLDAQQELAAFVGGSEVPLAPADVFDRLDAERENRKAVREEINRGRAEGKLTLDRMERLYDEDVDGIEAFPAPRDVEARRSRSPHDDE
jgi:hypothetical protein